MVDMNKIEAFLSERRATFVSKVKIRPSDDVILLTVPVENVAQKSGGSKTSKRQLGYLKRAMQEEFGVDVVIIYDQGEAFAQVESVLEEAVKNQFKAVDSVVLSSESMERAVVWISCASREIEIDTIEVFINDFLSLMGWSSYEVHFFFPTDEVPPLIMVVRTMKACAPCSLEELQRSLQETGYPSIRSQWLQAKLDLLRKKGVVLRQKNKTYCLSHLGLSVTPHGAYRTSSDVERALALGRAKW